MKVAAIQLTSQDDVAENLSEAARQVERAAREGAELCVLPEAFAFFGPEEEKAKHAEAPETPGPILSRLAELACTHRVHLIAGGMAEKSDDPSRPFNTSVAFSAEGEVVGLYRKVHLFDVSLKDGTLKDRIEWQESRATSPGTGPVVVQLGQMIFGLSICYDLRFPEIYAAERQAGATVLTVPAAFTSTTGEAHWHLLLRSRAVETQCWVVAAAQEGTHPQERKTFGHAMIVDPWGRISAERTAPGPGFVLWDLDDRVTAEVRSQMPMIHRLSQK